MMIFVRLFFEFFKAGLFAIGGGMATLPFLYNISDKTGWFTYGQLADMVAILRVHHQVRWASTWQLTLDLQQPVLLVQ